MDSRRVLGVILAGGLSRRMEGPEKTLMEIRGAPLIAHVHARLARQLVNTIINANGDASRFAFLGIPVVPDSVSGFAGPLAGTLAAMEHVQEQLLEYTHILTVAGDTPFFPRNLAERLLTAADIENSTNRIAIARSDGNRHPTFACWPTALASDLRRFLVDENERKVMLFAERYDLHWVDFDVVDEALDPFFNINTPADFERATQLMEEA